MASLADIEAFNDRIPGGVPQADTGRAQAMLDDASALIRSEAGKTWEDEAVPEIVKTICMSAAKRAFLNPDGVEAIAVDGNSASLATASPDVYLTSKELRHIHRAAGKSSVWTLETTRGDLETPPVQDGDEILDAGPLSDFP